MSNFQDESRLLYFQNKTISVLCLNKCIYNLHIYHLHIDPFPINYRHNVKGWGENQRIMLHDETSFLTLTFPTEKWFPRAYTM